MLEADNRSAYAIAREAGVAALDYNNVASGFVYPGALEAMQRQKEEYRVAAWKTYTQWGPEGTGYWLDDEQYGIPFIERARALKVPIICVHKGIPLFGLPYEHSTCRDIGIVRASTPM